MAAPPDLTLGQLVARSLRNADLCQNAPAPNDPHIQALVASTLSDLTLCASLIDRLGVLSPNESLDDLSTRSLRCLAVPALQGHLALLVRTRGAHDRLEWLARAQAAFDRFREQVERYGVVEDERRAALNGPAVGETDPARRRAGKIAQFKMEKEIKATLEELRQRRRTRRTRGSAVPSSSAASSSAGPSAPAPSDSATATQDANVDYPSSSSDEDDDASASIARPLLLSLLTLHYLRSSSELDSLAHECDILEHGIKTSEIPPPAHVGDAREKGRRGGAGGAAEEGDEEEDRWRLDAPLGGKEGPMLSPSGKVLRPFTILPSSSSGGAMNTRLRLQGEVFRESWRLPTMTIDEYLAIEQERGNVLEGGGERTTDEVDAARRAERADVEEDDTQGGYEAQEAGLRKKREWDDYRDVHRKGEGNMHNRG
ncbi:Tap42p [Rhodotorula paludigena]|uniref:Tap42p n=1 Tax=Rhodotorula paludigena TaxID=86838 RepID=UPI00317DA89E